MSSFLFSSLIFSFSRIFIISLRYIYASVLNDEFTLFLNLPRISFLYTVSTIKTNEMESDGNMELDDQPYDSYASDDTSESDFDFDYDELVDNLDELELSDEDSDVYAEELISMTESSITDSGFTSKSPKEVTPVSFFRNIFHKEILKLITDQTNIYGKRKKRSNHQKKSNWKDVSRKKIESFLGLIILMNINNLPNMKLYWSNDMVFQNTFITSIM